MEKAPFQDVAFIQLALRAKLNSNSDKHTTHLPGNARSDVVLDLDRDFQKIENTQLNRLDWADQPTLPFIQKSDRATPLA